MTASQEQEIVITGQALRLPGANSPAEFWRVLSEGVDCTDTVSDRRRELAFAPRWRDTIGEIDGIEMFDAAFFDIDPDEAATMDPQHRITMEVAHDAIGNAGLLDTGETRSRRYSVFSAMSTNAYYPLVCQRLEAEGEHSVHPRTIMNSMNSALAARISHQYDFTGPVMAVDTACSSFLTAMALAADSIRHQRCDGAIVAGVNLLSSAFTNALCNCGGITTGLPFTRVFDERADGTLIGEGAVVVVLERADIARRKNRSVLGTIRAYEVNNDGASLNIMAPNPRGQAAVIRDCYSPASASGDGSVRAVDHTRIGYIETHGTGTRIGDPIELNALGQVYRKADFGDATVGIGSVKSNIGHLLSAAGGAGLSKLLLSMRHGTMVPSPHFEIPNPLLELDSTPFEVIAERTPWPRRDDAPRLGAITSLGLGGTNVHFVIEEGDARSTSAELEAPVLCVSAKTPQARERLLRDAESAIAGGADAYDVAMTLARFRTAHPWRAAATIASDGTGLTGIRRSFVERPAKRVLLRSPAHGVAASSEIESRVRSLLAGRVRVTDASAEAGELSVVPCTAGVCVRDGDHEPHLDLHLTDIEMAAELHLRGARVDWMRVFPDFVGSVHELPPYPFEREPHWLDL
ncbi:acyl transferase domain-containing protein [Clavibacter michiganensis]|uniref:polyketide synthase n=1 Tax=Clavibacter michiganensis TaxID=28447 RepID=UPI00195CF981|nr:polyketide synthase [Clavibacter michiganensis]MBM7411149.1 acyl transferase domain-containing protein [Clavibacter michiganensis]